VFTLGLIISSEDVVNPKRHEEQFLVADLSVLIMKILVIVYLVKQWNDVIREANKTLKYTNQLRITVNHIHGGPTKEFIEMVS
jgi:FMN-dependent NADH-azoreductase